MEGTLVKALDSLRPFVQSLTWDYCVFWKWGHAPSRYIELAGCCCSGGYRTEQIAVKEEGYPLGDFCRDTRIHHFVRTTACKSLAALPSSFLLCSGIHGEIVVSSQPSWISSDSNLNSSHALIGTQVLIPVGVGLLELSSANQIPRDERIIEFLRAKFNLVDEHEAHISQFRPLAMRAESPNSCPRSSVGSGEVERNPKALKPSKKSADCMEGNGKKVVKSKNLMCERNRRNKMREGLLALRSIVPKISKMDKISTMGDAIDYIVELQTEVKKLEAELQVLEDNKGIAPHENSYDLCNNGENDVQAKVEVEQIGRTKGVLVKMSGKKKRGGFVKVMEGMDELGFEVVDATMSTFHDTVFHLLKLEMMMILSSEDELRDSLIRLTDLLKYSVLL